MCAERSGRTGKMILSYLIFCVFIVYVQCAEQTMKAEFNMNGVTGYIQMTESAAGEPTTIQYKLSGVTEALSVNVATNPVDWQESSPCSNIGNNQHQLPDVDGSSQSSHSSTTTAFDLVGAKSVQGRAIVLLKKSDSSVLSCATLERRSFPFPTAMVRFSGVLSGTIFFREAGPEVTVWSRINSRSSVTSGIKWSVKTGKVASTSDTSAMCSNLGATIANGDLSSRLGDLTANSPQFFLDTELTVSALEGNSLVLTAGSDTLCADFHKFSGRTTGATFNMDGVTGDISFSQHSPLDPVEVSGSLENLRSMAKNYHIHEFPVPPRMSKTDNVCGGDSVAGHFNPFGVDSSTSPTAGTGTYDKYEVGDLSGKYGTLEGQNKFTLSSKYDWNLNLYTRNGVLGRSIVIHLASDGSRWVCANIRLPYSDAKTAVATFKYPVIGHVFFQQDLANPLGETTVYAALGHHKGGATSNHNFHVHTGTVGDDMVSDTSRCQSVAGHYNPWSVAVDQAYSTACTQQTPDACEVGDNSNKGGTLDIGDSQGKWKHKFYTDVNLPLAGEFSIIGRSLTIHAADKGSSRLACADIVPLHPKTATVNAWTTDIQGFITFKQDHPWDIANTLLDLSNLQAIAGPYHIHEWPVPQGASSPCSGDSVGGHFNPFEVDASGSPSPGTGTYDKYEVGDLSGKFGKVSGKQIVQDRFYDSNNPLYGPLSTVGRSVVFHKDSDGSRWSCGTVTLNKTKMAAGKTYQALANFTAGELVGYIKLSQYVFDDGSMAETSVEYNIEYTDSSKKTQNHNWHVHEKPVEGDQCSSTAGHYNPYLADVAGTYSTDCSVSNPLRCELGDLAGKYGLKIDIGGGARLATDVDLPLVGKYAVVGRSIVIHDKDAGPGRFVCADILPMDTVSVKLNFPKLSNFTKTSLRDTVVTVLGTDTWNVQVGTPVVSGQCTEVDVLLSGKTKSDLKTLLETRIEKEDYRLTNYLSTNTCAADSASSLKVPSVLMIFTAAVLLMIANRGC